jgi:hypothetical protein
MQEIGGMCQLVLGKGGELSESSARPVGEFGHIAVYPPFVGC